MLLEMQIKGNKGVCKMKLLFVNACARKDSRTLELCRYFLKEYQQCHSDVEIEEINICEEKELLPMNEERLILRNDIIQKKDWNHAMMKYALQWNQAEKILIAAPYWDWSFPSVLKIYVENIMISELNFVFRENRSVGLCKGQKMLYVTTAGGNAEQNMGYDYMKRVLLELGEYQSQYVHADNLDVYGIDIDAIMKKAKSELHEMVKDW